MTTIAGHAALSTSEALPGLLPALPPFIFYDNHCLWHREFGRKHTVADKFGQLRCNPANLPKVIGEGENGLSSSSAGQS